MKVHRFSLKKLLLFLGILFLLLFLMGVLVYQLRVPISEYRYERNPTDANLIKLSMQLVDSKNYDKMMKYLPKAAKLDNFVEVSKSNKLFISENQNSDLAAEDTYRIIVVKGALSYIYAEKYYEFHSNFPELYNKIVFNNAYSTWQAAMEERDKITEEGYENIIQALEENTPPLVDVTPENSDAIREYAICLLLKISVYDNIGDKQTGSELHNEYLQLLRELDSVMKEAE